MRNKVLFTFIIGLLAVIPALAAGKFTLVIDAGHGGHDSGAPGAISKEKDINLKVALAFGKLVERNCSDVKVIYTRTTDVFVPLIERANIANRNKADLFISVHTNALDGGKISRGFETYTLGMHRANDNLNVAKRENSVILIEKNYKQRYAGFDPNSSESYIMFELMQDKNMANSVDLAKLIQGEVCAISGRVNKGVHQAGFLVLRETSMPSCLIELGFITTPDEEKYLNTSDGQNTIAMGIYNAFLKYKKRYGATKLSENDRDADQDNANLLAQNEPPATPPSTPPAAPKHKSKTGQTTPAPAVQNTEKDPDSGRSGQSSDKALQARNTGGQKSPTLAQSTTESPFVVEDSASVTQYTSQRAVRTTPFATTPPPQPPTASAEGLVAQATIQKPASPPATASPQPQPKPTPVATPNPPSAPQTPAAPPAAPAAPKSPVSTPTPEKPAIPSSPTKPQQGAPATPQPQQPQPQAQPKQPQPQAQPQQPQPQAQPQQPQPQAQPQQPQPQAQPQQLQPQAQPQQPQPQPQAQPQQPQPQAQPKQPQPQPAATEKPAAPVQSVASAEPGGRPIFKVQIAASSQQLPTDHAVFKGIPNVDVYVENDLFKYTVGATPDFEEISQLRKTVSEQFPQAFIIAFRDGEKIALAQAIREYKNAKQKVK